MLFKASLDRTTKVFTYLITILFLGISILQIFLIRESGIAIHLITIIFIALTYILVWACSPLKYTVTTEALIIHRYISNVEIKRKDIHLVEEISKDKLAYSIRTFGVGGLFGYFGNFINRNLGSMKWYATRRSNYILIETSVNKKIIVTPDDTKGFVAALL